MLVDLKIRVYGTFLIIIISSLLNLPTGSEVHDPVESLAIRTAAPLSKQDLLTHNDYCIPDNSEKC